MTTVYADDPIYGGFNSNDATNTLQNAINSGADKVIVANIGNPWLISRTIFLKSNQEIVFAPDVVVKAKSGTFLSNNEPLFRALSIDNIKLVGEGIGARQATLAMNKNEYTDPTNTNEYGHIIGIDGTNNYTISGLTLTGAGGDGILIDGAYSGTFTPNLRAFSADGLIDNVTSTNNRRNGLSVISAQNLTIKNSKFTSSAGTGPAAGIDFEPDFSHERLNNIKLSNVDLSGNDGNGLSFILSALDNNSTSVDISVDGATINSNKASGIKVGTYYTNFQPNSNAASSTPNGAINISNVTIKDTKATDTFEPNAAISIQAVSGDRSDPNNLKVNFNNVAISNTAQTGFSAPAPISVLGFGGLNDRNQIGNLAFNNVTVADNFNRPVIGIQLNQSGSFNNITGNITGINPNGVTTNVTSTATKNNYTLGVTSASAPVGTSGDDTFSPGKGAMAIDGGVSGNDTLSLNNMSDTTATQINYTTATNGTITGGSNDGMTFKNIAGFDITTGSASDTINLSAASSGVTVKSGAGNDTINGGTSNDTIFGEAGNDTLYGRAGNDVFGFNKPTEGIDKIMDFGTGNDKIGISRSGFGGSEVFGSDSLVGSALDSSRFTLGTTATTASQRFVYNQQSATLFYDRDGVGGAAQVRIAQMIGNPTLTNTSFVVL